MQIGINTDKKTVTIFSSHKLKVGELVDTLDALGIDDNWEIEFEKIVTTEYIHTPYIYYPSLIYSNPYPYSYINGVVINKTDGTTGTIQFAATTNSTVNLTANSDVTYVLDKTLEEKIIEEMKILFKD